MDETNLTLWGSTAHFLFASTDTIEYRSPLKVQVSNKHQWKTKANSDVQWPVLFWVFNRSLFNSLVCKNETWWSLSLRFSFFYRIFTLTTNSFATCDYPYFVCASKIEHFIIFIYQNFLCLWLSLPKCGIEGTNQLHLTIDRHFFDNHSKLNCIHCGPYIWHNLR